jgi:predicted esterase
MNRSLLFMVPFAFALMGLGAGSLVAQDDLADVRSKRIRLDGHPKLQYELIGAAGELTTPEHGYKVLVVLPGGDGSGDFTPFVKRMWKHALSDEYFVIQPIAPKWNNKQQVVWPTEKLPERGMKTSTEEFIRLAVEDLAKKTKLDERHVFALGWSSGGPAVYAASVADNSPITGTFAAMSVFKPAQMDDLERANGQAYYLLHSADDQVCPYRFAEQAVRTLSEHGAKTKLATYDGGHGWQGDVYGNLRAGIDWLEEQVE